MNKSFSNTKSKLFKLFNENQSQKNKIDIQKNINLNLNNEINLSKKGLLTCSTYKNYTIDFENPDTIVTNSEGQITAIIKSWEIDIGIISEELIPFIRIDYIARVGSNNNSIESSFQFGNGLATFNKYFQIIDTENDTLKQVKLLASLLVTSTLGLLEPYQLSLSIYLQNPNDFS